MNIKHFAAVGSDGRRPVVWGVGRHVDPRVAEQDALIEAQSELREAGAVGDYSGLRTVEIDAARAVRISQGDVDASDL